GAPCPLRAGPGSRRSRPPSRPPSSRPALCCTSAPCAGSARCPGRRPPTSRDAQPGVPLPDGKVCGRAQVRPQEATMTEAPARVRLSRSARRAQLLVAARDVFAAQGYHAAAMDDIAARAEFSTPVLSQHFPATLELYRALLTTCADDLVERVREAIAATSDNHERVEAAVSAYFDFVARDGQAYRLVFEAGLRGGRRGARAGE